MATPPTYPERLANMTGRELREELARVSLIDDRRKRIHRMSAVKAEIGHRLQILDDLAEGKNPAHEAPPIAP